jgi:AcrR family transcriptional regulator
MNDIAARAGKAAIYRRWSSKAALITDALVDWRPNLLSDDAPDTGSLVGELDSVNERAKRNDENIICNDLLLRVGNLNSNDLVVRVALEATRHLDLAASLDPRLVTGRRRDSDNEPAARHSRTHRRRHFRATSHRNPDSARHLTRRPSKTSTNNR